MDLNAEFDDIIRDLNKIAENDPISSSAVDAKTITGRIEHIKQFIAEQHTTITIPTKFTVGIAAHNSLLFFTEDDNQGRSNVICELKSVDEDGQPHLAIELFRKLRAFGVVVDGDEQHLQTVIYNSVLTDIETALNPIRERIAKLKKSNK
jgi:hypothetical protein